MRWTNSTHLCVKQIAFIVNQECIMSFVLCFPRVLITIATAVAMAASAATDPPTRAQALSAIEQPSATVRYGGVQRLGEIGTMTDANRLAKRLHDDDARVRQAAAASMWQIWSRSDDPAIDALYQRGLQEMEAAQLREAVATFSSIIQKKPAFAEAWNKRATLYFMMGEWALSLKDCDEVMQRNPNHFGALSGYGQIYMNLGDFANAITYFERALTVNPNLPGVAATIKLLEQKLQQKQRNTV
jgi:tetratricopeptide (TPR) repeat protein